jgi:UDP-glucose/GDP-mannose dehydrogenase family, NAD binding domain
LTVPFALVSNPEFLNEVAALEDLMRPNRTIVGSYDRRAVMPRSALHSTFTHNHVRVTVMDSENPDFDAIKTRLKQTVVVDGRNLYEPALMRQHAHQFPTIHESSGMPRAGGDNEWFVQACASISLLPTSRAISAPIIARQTPPNQVRRAFA